MERLRAQRNLVPSALEEALRYYAPVKLVVRWAVTETTIGDQRIEAGQVLFAWIVSANRDEAEFPAHDIEEVAERAFWLADPSPMNSERCKFVVL